MQASIEKVINQINFESKMIGIPEDKKFARFIAKCISSIELTYRELQEAMLAKLQNIKKLPLKVQKLEKEEQKENVEVKRQ